MSFLIVAVICTAMMLPGFISYGFLSLLEKKKEDYAILFFSGTMFLVGLSRTAALLIAFTSVKIAPAYHWNLAYEASLMLFFPVVPYFLSTIFQTTGRFTKFNRRLIPVGFAVAAVFIGIIILRPSWYLQAAPIEELENIILLGRGAFMPASFISMGLLFVLTVYSLVYGFYTWLRSRRKKYLTTLNIGMVFCIILLLGEFYEVYTGRYPGPLPKFAYPRTLVALTVFSLTAVVSISQKTAVETRDLFRKQKELKKDRDELEWVAYIDKMTGLPNRQALFRDLERHCVPGWYMMVIDIDNLVYVNNFHGYGVGDELIQRTADICREVFPRFSMAYRTSADTFAILMKTEVGTARDLVSRALKMIADLPVTGAGEDRFTASAGIASADGCPDWEEWINRCDTAMERAKEGRNRYVVFDPAFYESETRKHDIISGMRHSLDRSGFTMRYQPIITGGRRLVGAEALIRWEHPELGPIGPDEFIPLAEVTGMISRITRFVVERTLQDFSDGLDCCPDLKVNINLSARDMEDRNLLKDLNSILERYPTSEGLLGFEVTETEMIGNWDTSINIVKSLRERGFSISLDDFGTGYSSLSYLNLIPLDRLKIDRSFISDLPGNDRKGILLDTIIRLGHELDLELVVEGVESLEQLEYLTARKCRLFQGYYFAAPMAIEDFRSWASSADGPLPH